MAEEGEPKAVTDLVYKIGGGVIRIFEGIGGLFDGLNPEEPEKEYPDGRIPMRGIGFNLNTMVETIRPGE